MIKCALALCAHHSKAVCAVTLKMRIKHLHNLIHVIFWCVRVFALHIFYACRTNVYAIYKYVYVVQYHYRPFRRHTNTDTSLLLAGKSLLCWSWSCVLWPKPLDGWLLFYAYYWIVCLHALLDATYKLREMMVLLGTKRTSCACFRSWTNCDGKWMWKKEWTGRPIRMDLIDAKSITRSPVELF